MGLAALRAPARYGPLFRPEVHFVKARTSHFIGAARRQNRELKCTCCNAFLFLQRPHKARNLTIGQGGVMLCPPQLGPVLQYLVQVAAPAGGIFSGSIPAYTCI